jgi:3-deoxy-D-manno-octulosonate 8-phosphate phosphatase KdsC-like HAD superfamily phosphatase
MAFMNKQALLSASTNATPSIRSIAKYISAFKGGEGRIGEIIEKVQTLNKHWDLNLMQNEGLHSFPLSDNRSEII